MENSRALTLENYLEDVSTNVENIYIPLAIKTPSELSGMSKEDERKLRLYGVSLIQHTGILLKLSQSAIS